MSRPVYQVDAFTDTAFAGNPAAVCLLATERPDAWLQDVAAEMALSETAFLRPQSDGRFRLRWFTPTDEVRLCGHATLASAHVLWEEGIVAADASPRFDTRSGALSARRHDDRITMNFPADPPRPSDAPTMLEKGLPDTTPEYVGLTGRDYFVRLPSATAVHSLSPDLSALATLDTRGVIVTAPADTEEADFVSRFFAPGVGVPEDPVTGSAHCALGPYWSDELNRTTLTGRQVSERGGTIHVTVNGPEAGRIELGGHAVTTLRGRLAA
jgi:PhzF family phenazine biosynthesis protein